MNTTEPSFSVLLQRFFTQRLMQQKKVSPHTLCSYRDTFRLLLRFAQRKLRATPELLSIEQIDAPFVTGFLNDLESNRGVSARTRNLRLTAIRLTSCRAGVRRSSVCLRRRASGTRDD